MERAVKDWKAKMNIKGAINKGDKKLMVRTLASIWHGVQKRQPCSL